MSSSTPTRPELPNESLALFERKMAKFMQLFCDSIASGNDFTLRLEVRGNKKELIHARVYTDDIERVAGVEKRIEAR